MNSMGSVFDSTLVTRYVTCKLFESYSLALDESFSAQKVFQKYLFIFLVGISWQYPVTFYCFNCIKKVH